MNINEFCLQKDVPMIRELRDISQDKMAEVLDVSRSTIERWESGEVETSEVNIEKVYSYAYKNNISINRIKEQLYKEDCTNATHKILFHGAKSIISGPIELTKSRVNNDFGQGFYCGELLEQSAMFVSSYPRSSIYIIDFNQKDLKCVQYDVNQDWMLTIAYFRGKLREYKDTDRVKSLLQKIEDVDYIVAPIADNRMFQIIDSFIDGEITDEQCRHCLSATNLGYQYIMKSQKAVSQIQLLERCYLCQYEKDLYINKRRDDNKISEDKVKIARKQYRGKGLYIDEILV